MDHMTATSDTIARPQPGATRWQKVVGVLGLIVVLWVGDRLYTVIDRGSTGPAGGHGPGDNTPTNQPTEGEPTPGGGTTGGHDPSQFDH